MADFQASFTGGIRNAFCQSLPRVVAGGLLFSALTAETGVGFAAGLATAGGAAAIYSLGCNREIPASAFPAVQFTGGQCAGVSYRVTTNQDFVWTTGVRPSGTQGQDNIVRGPISSVTFTVVTPPDGTRLEIHSADGVFQTTVNTSSAGGGVPGNYVYSNLRTSIARVDGAADTCGDPAPTAPPVNAGDNHVTVPVSYTNYDGTTITNNYNVVFGFAYVNASAELTIPFTANVALNPSLNVTGTLNVKTGDVNINLGSPDSPARPESPCSPAPSNPVNPPPVPTGFTPSNPVTPPPNDKPELRKILRGALVTVTSHGYNQTIIFEGSNPDVYVPDLGFVQFLLQRGNTTGWSQIYKVNNLRQLIQCDWSGGAIDVRGTPRPNVTWEITPIYTQQSYPRQYPPEV